MKAHDLLIRLLKLSAEELEMPVVINRGDTIFGITVEPAIDTAIIRSGYANWGFMISALRIEVMNNDSRSEQRSAGVLQTEEDLQRAVQEDQLSGQGSDDGPESDSGVRYSSLEHLDSEGEEEVTTVDAGRPRFAAGQRQEGDCGEDDPEG